MRPDFVDSYWSSPVVKDLSQVDFHPLIVPRLAGQDTEGLDQSALEVLEIGELDPDSISLRPRSLPMLELAPVETVVLDAGRLSPGMRIGELQPGRPQQEVRFSSSERGTRRIEVLCSRGLPEEGEISIDGSPVTWSGPSAARPDVCSGDLNLNSGEHRLSFLDVPAQGLTFALADQGISFDSFPFEQGLHAGRRLLLSNTVSDPAAVEISRAPNGLLDLKIVSLPAYVVLDLGRTIHGRLSAAVSGPPGAVVDIGWDERLFRDSLRPLPYPGSLHPQWNQVDSWVLDGARRRLSSIDARAGRYLLIAAWGTGPVQFDNLQVHEERLPLTKVGEFSSPDPLLNAAWKIGADTLYPNMGDAYADPWRERGQWWGDAYVADHANRAVFGDAALLRRGIQFMAEAIIDGKPNALAPNGSGLHMIDYGMLWVQSVADYVERTGDLSVLEQVYPQVRQFLAYASDFESPATGLLDIQEGPWTETAYVDTIGQASRSGQSTAVNAMYFGTLVDASRLAELVGEPGEAARLMDKSASIQHAVNTHLFRPGLHRYVSSIRGSTTLAPSAHAQAWALAYGLVPSEQVEQVAQALVDLIAMQPLAPDVEIYGTFWVLEALGKAGKLEAGTDLINVYYGHLLDSGATTTWEIYNADQSFTQSLSHAWGSAPTWFLTTYLLGARQTGATSWEVQPAFAVVDQVSGKLPLPLGPLEISWTADGPGDLSVSIVSPAGASGNVILPRIPGATLSVNGSNWSIDPVHSEEIQFSEDLISVPLGEGKHEVHLSSAAGEPELP
jgi:alpha-L-rhamnosidase